MNFNELSINLSKKLHLRKSFSQQIITVILDEISKELRNEGRVYLQKLGAFHPINRPARRWYDPRSKKIKTKPACKDVVFYPSKTLLQNIRMNKPKALRTLRRRRHGGLFAGYSL